MKITLLDGSGLYLKYLLRSKDRHGNVRIYVRRFTNGPRIRIRALANVEEFMAAYRAALETGATTEPVNSSAAPGSLMRMRGPLVKRRTGRDRCLAARRAAYFGVAPATFNIATKARSGTITSSTGSCSSTTALAELLREDSKVEADA